MKYQVSLTTAQLLVKCLEVEGVDYIFGIPGEENLDIINNIGNGYRFV
ncbi:hypothetical protein KM792_09950 [Clostridium tyrobutyricum]|uniref:Thiamine pyrophosphate enzyme N-terminal TPP-binding domain-containing protein n=1 Tax=Clostridium tyrobutyricum DIVETGP TaxID=1408889 RepID=W6N6L0_CLOTY|nr:thiamine pyrophosphate-binding protein [Clostridium tyrobutyricum]CDL92313.1 hypothetical protein CTDIVETGP_2383 [Clostridium tyrobutyricum DIVETGP]AND83875.1 hypothetical protein CTK_C06120 [Clostridium tyrobutyricum]MBR9648546.1 hypothetical protein [Clostridium tyrobutyricum]MBV4425094.1 hypothetical protein [Clostridium tyrobutyricum]MBV4437305.1 hypothetical protein [Clostridium tyrobutyricum]